MKVFKNYGLLALVFSLIIGMEMNSQTKKDKDFIKEKDKETLVVDAKYALEKLEENNKDVSRMASEAYGYVIFPNVGKGAFIAGGAAGNGVVYQGGNQVGWAKLRQVDVGLQIGGEAFIEAIFFQSKQDLDEFMSSEFEFTGGVSAVAITEGESRKVNFEDGMAVVTMPKGGAMIEISVGGQKFKYQDK